MEHAVIVTLRLVDGAFGSDAEKERISELVDELEATLNASGKGEYDGEEFGGGKCMMYMYGPDANSIFDIAKPVLKRSKASLGGHVILRFGDVGDMNAIEERVEL